MFQVMSVKNNRTALRFQTISFSYDYELTYDNTMDDLHVVIFS